MAEAPIEMWEMQVAFAIGLLGIYAGWRGSIAKMTGFYDISGAVKTLLFGLIAGVIAASLIDLMISSNEISDPSDARCHLTLLLASSLVFITHDPCTNFRTC